LIQIAVREFGFYISVLSIKLI